MNPADLAALKFAGLMVLASACVVVGVVLMKRSVEILRRHIKITVRRKL
jgi:hypothetical protein